MRKYKKGLGQVLALPLHGDLSYLNRLTINKAQYQVLELAKLFSNQEQAFKQGYEEIIDLDAMEFKQKVNFQKKLQDQRKKLENKESLAENIILIYIDAHSRVKFKEKNPLTHQLIKELNQQNDTFEFFRFHTTVPYTVDNVASLFYGIPDIENELYVKSKQKTYFKEKNLQSKFKDEPYNHVEAFESFQKDLQNNGYITSLSASLCHDWVTELDFGYNQFYHNLAWDHIGINSSCDPNYQIPSSPSDYGKGPYSSFDRCLYGKRQSVYNLEYADQFWRKYKDSRKFQMIEFFEAHEVTGELITTVDEGLSTFFRNLNRDGLLKDTTIIFLSDHGHHMGGIYFILDVEQYNVEQELPIFIVSQDKKIFENHFQFKENMKENQQVFTQIIKVHHYIKTLIYGYGYEKLSQSPVSIQKRGQDCYSEEAIFFPTISFCRCVSKDSKKLTIDYQKEYEVVEK